MLVKEDLVEKSNPTVTKCTWAYYWELSYHCDTTHWEKESKKKEQDIGTQCTKLCLSISQLYFLHKPAQSRPENGTSGLYGLYKNCHMTKLRKLVKCAWTHFPQVHSQLFSNNTTFHPLMPTFIANLQVLVHYPAMIPLKWVLEGRIWRLSYPSIFVHEVITLRTWTYNLIVASSRHL